MDYIRTEANGQLTFTQSTDFLRIPSCLYGFRNNETTTRVSKSGRNVFCFEGTLSADEGDSRCSCGSKMHVNNHPGITLRHLPFGGNLSCVSFKRNQYICPKCGKTKTQFISFKAPGHMITEELYQYTRDLLASGNYTNKEVADITGLGKKHGEGHRQGTPSGTVYNSRRLPYKAGKTG